MSNGRREPPGRVAIFGAGGLGRELLQVMRDIAASGLPCEPVSFIVDPGLDAPASLHGVPVARDAVAMLRADPGLRMVVALGDPAAREAVVARITASTGPRFATLLHPRAWIGDTVEVGEGSMIFGFASATTDIRIGRHVLVNPACAIAHDCVLEDFATLAPGVMLAGGAWLEAGCNLGTGAKVLPRQRIGRGAVVGGGALVRAAVAAGATVVGVPARDLARPTKG